MPQLSAILIIRDEAAQLAECLGRLHGLCDEVVVVDSGSADGSIEVARRFTDRVFAREFAGFGPQKQFALNQTTGEWVLALDADERVTPVLRSEIAAILQDPGAADGYEIRREVYFLGRRLRHGGLGRDRVLRLFRRERGRFSDDLVHEQVLVDGRTGSLRTPLEHHTHRSLRHYVEKVNLYSDLAARTRFDRGGRFHWWMHLRPGWEFCSRFILRGGFLDGHAGLLYAGLTAYAGWLRALKLWELGRGEREGSGVSRGRTETGS